MAEYIEREASLKAILNLPPKMDEQGYGWLGRRGVWQMLLDFPAADVQPVRHGRWIDEPIKGIRYHCSICFGRFDYTWHYCPNCGAKMDGGILHRMGFECAAHRFHQTAAET